MMEFFSPTLIEKISGGAKLDTKVNNPKWKSMFLMCSEKVRATDHDCVSIKIDISFPVKIVFIYLYKYLCYI